MQYSRKEDKNTQCKAKTGYGFQDVVTAIMQGQLLDIVDHHNQEEYSHQKKLIINLSGYIYYIPCYIDGNTCNLITIIPSRKETKKYL